MLPKTKQDIPPVREEPVTPTRLFARSTSRPVWAQFLGTRPRPHPGTPWRVLAVFDRACHLVTTGGQVAALVCPDIGNGPLNMVVEGRSDRWPGSGQPGAFRSVRPGMAVHLQATSLQIGDLEVALDRAQVWEPCPAWERLRVRREAIVDRLPLLRSLALDHAPGDSLLALQVPGRRADSAGSSIEATITTANQAAETLRAGWQQGDAVGVQRGATQLAGLGSGLTPAGDDFLAGAMLWAWLVYPAPRPFCHLVLESAALHTTILSAALLRAAGRGECSAPWHRLLAALAEGGEARLARAVQDVRSYGHTSGSDALAGFLWLGIDAQVTGERQRASDPADVSLAAPDRPFPPTAATH